MTLTGAGGSGKTRLALELGQRLGSHFQSAVWFVALTDLTEAEQIPAAIRAALDLQESPNTHYLEQIGAVLGVQPSLLILDNLEHLVDEGASLVQHLIEAIPTLSCVVTSRRRLELVGEREFQVGPLPIPEADDLAQLRDIPSVQLFIDRAQAARPDFQITTANASDIAELCRRLEGIPLALELAAARAQVLAPAQMLTEMERRFEFLVSTRRDIPSRHRTLSAALDWSYQSLSADLQQFFCRLSVFRGGWTVESARSVCDEPLALDKLAALCGLVLSQDLGAEVRFRLLETVREYAWDKLTEEERAPLERRHWEYFAHVAEAAENELEGPQQTAWLQRLEWEHDNLRTTCAYGQTALAGEPEYLRVLVSLGRFWELHGHLREGRQWLTRGLEAHGRDEPSSLLGKALNVAGALARNQADYEAADRYHQEALATYRAVDEALGVADALVGLGNVAQNLGEYAKARRFYGEALKARLAGGDEDHTAEIVHNLGLLSMLIGDSTEATRLYQEALSVWRATGDPQNVARALHSLGSVALLKGDYAEAEALLTEGLLIARKAVNRRSSADLLSALASVARTHGQHAAAREFGEESLALRRELNDRRGIAGSLNILGAIARDLGESERARSLHEEAVHILRELGNRRGIADALAGLGEAERALGDYKAAARVHAESLAMRRELDDARSIGLSLHLLALTALDQGNHQQAAELLAECLTASRQGSNLHDMAVAIEGIAALCARDSASHEQKEDLLELTKRSAVLWGAACEMRDEAQTPMSPAQQAEFDEYWAALQETLGPEEARASFAVGRSLAGADAGAAAAAALSSLEHRDVRLRAQAE